MKSLGELKQEKEDRVSQLIKDCSMFFAFSNEQFKENKTPLQEGEKYVSLGMGAYLPKGKVDKYIDGIESIGKWFNDEINDNKLRKENILYELNNHEAFYTHEIEDTVAALGDGYSYIEVKDVFWDELRKTQI